MLTPIFIHDNMTIDLLWTMDAFWNSQVTVNI
jgi:hypothetical protein